MSSWPGEYDSNIGQTVTCEDAESMAFYLEKALDDIPNQSRDIDKNFEYGPDEKTGVGANGLLISPLGECVSVPNHRPGCIEYICGDGKLGITEYIPFCRESAFCILQICPTTRPF